MFSRFCLALILASGLPGAKAAAAP
jgi:hypothetical protein